MLKRLVFLILLSIATINAVAQDDLSSRQIEYDGMTRSYLIQLPQNYDPEQVSPVLVVLHGAGMSGFDMMFTSSFNHLNKSPGVIVAYPNGIERGWNYLDADQLPDESMYVDDVGLLGAIFDQIAEEYRVDEEQFYVMGYSNGGLLALRAMCDLSDRLAGVIAIGANMSFEIAQHCTDTQPVSMTLILGTRDHAFPWQGHATLAEDGRIRSRFSIAQTMPFIASINGCVDNSTLVSVSTPDSPLDVVRERFGECAEGVTVQLYAIIEGSHDWPHAPEFMLDNGELGDIRDVVWQAVVKPD